MERADVVECHSGASSHTVSPAVESNKYSRSLDPTQLPISIFPGKYYHKKERKGKKKIGCNDNKHTEAEFHSSPPNPNAPCFSWRIHNNNSNNIWFGFSVGGTTMSWKARVNRVGMGASLSSLGTNGSTIGPGLGDIPENCVARVFLHLTPPEICNLARLNRAFRGAASADSVWQTKLPPNYQHLLDLFPPERYQNLSKKDIFALLSRPLPFDDGNKVGFPYSSRLSVRDCVLFCFVRSIDGAMFCSMCGSIGSREGFACLSRQKPCPLLELMIADTGLGFPLKNLGYIPKTLILTI